MKVFERHPESSLAARLLCELLGARHGCCLSWDTALGTSAAVSAVPAAGVGRFGAVLL